jgi:hypothetical protein
MHRLPTSYDAPRVYRASQSGKVGKLEATLAQQQTSFESKFAYQQKQIDALTAGLQKVSAQLAVSKPAPQTVLNNHLKLPSATNL